MEEAPPVRTIHAPNDSPINGFTKLSTKTCLTFHSLQQRNTVSLFFFPPQHDVSMTIMFSLFILFSQMFIQFVLGRVHLYSGHAVV
jgi:hypothetical protein